MSTTQPPAQQPDFAELRAALAMKVEPVGNMCGPEHRMRALQRQADAIAAFWHAATPNVIRRLLAAYDRAVAAQPALPICGKCAKPIEGTAFGESNGIYHPHCKPATQPEMADHEAVRELLIECRAALAGKPSAPTAERIDELERICAETYQVIGILADEAGRFNDPAVAKALDNLSQQRLVHEDVLSFPCRSARALRPPPQGDSDEVKR